MGSDITVFNTRRTPPKNCSAHQVSNPLALYWINPLHFHRKTPDGAVNGEKVAATSDGFLKHQDPVVNKPENNTGSLDAEDNCPKFQTILKKAEEAVRLRTNREEVKHLIHQAKQARPTPQEKDIETPLSLPSGQEYITAIMRHDNQDVMIASLRDHLSKLEEAKQQVHFLIEALSSTGKSAEAAESNTIVNGHTPMRMGSKIRAWEKKRQNLKGNLDGTKVKIIYSNTDS